MNDRHVLIARKESVRQQIAQARRELVHEEARPAPSARRIQQLQARIDQLMAEEFNLRLAIDRAPLGQ